MVKALLYRWLGVVFTLSAVWQANPGQNSRAGSDRAGSDEERLIGAWHLARLEAPGAAGNSSPIV
jgi:hypothetical protein